jgi:hypothetical protein
MMNYLEDTYDKERVLRKLVSRLELAWEDMKNFGNHSRECTFSGECPTCGAKIGKCDIHEQTMIRRLSEMQESVDSIVKYVTIFYSA